MEVILTEDELRAKCSEWQKILRLQDWIINVGIRRERDFVTEGLAEILPCLPKRMATIRILDPIDYPENLSEPQDMELSLVHELLHIHLFPLLVDREDEMRQVAEEQAIEAISRGLVALKRGGEGYKVDIGLYQKYNFSSPQFKITDAEGPASVIFIGEQFKDLK